MATFWWEAILPFAEPDCGYRTRSALGRVIEVSLNTMVGVYNAYPAAVDDETILGWVAAAEVDDCGRPTLYLWRSTYVDAWVARAVQWLAEQDEDGEDVPTFWDALGATEATEATEATPPRRALPAVDSTEVSP